MTQKKLSTWLRLVTIILFFTGIFFFVGLTVLILLNQPKNVFHLKSEIFFLWSCVFPCYGVLFQFWKITNQISCENSFSMENAHSFMVMTKFGIAMFIIFFIRLFYGIFMEEFYFYRICYALLMLIISLVFSILCFALSKLVAHAYEVKQETEYTI